MNVKTQFVIGAFCLIAVAFGSCDTFKDEASPEHYSEVSKDIKGDWKLVSVLRNGIDITDRMDFSRFHLFLNEDNTYKFENYLPFIVKKNGTWKVDDPMYPFQLTFKEENGEAEVNTAINFLIANGHRRLVIELSPGCSMNKYVYAFENIAE